MERTEAIEKANKIFGARAFTFSDPVSGLRIVGTFAEVTNVHQSPYQSYSWEAAFEKASGTLTPRP